MTFNLPMPALCLAMCATSLLAQNTGPTVHISSGTLHVRHPVRKARRCAGSGQLPRQPFRILRLPRTRTGTSRRTERQLRVHGSDRSPQMDQAERCGIRRRSEQRNRFGFSAGGVSVHSLMTSPMARGLFQKTIVESGGSRDSVLTARPMNKDGVDPSYPVSAETIGISFAKSMGIAGTDETALTKLRALTAEEVVSGAPVRPGGSFQFYETTPILDGKVIMETAETAYKEHREPHIPIMFGSNSADTAGNRVRAATKEQFFARFGQWRAHRRRWRMIPTDPRT